MSVTSVDPATLDTGRAAARPRLRPRRTLNRLALALAGAASGAAGQILFNQDSLWDGLFLYGTGVTLFVAALASHRPGPAALTGDPGAEAEPAALRSGWRLTVGLWLMLLAAGISVFTFRLFASQDTYPQGWWLYLAGLGLLVGGVLLLTSRRPALAPAPANPLAGRQVMLGLLLIVGLALFMRLYNFYSQPFGIWYDEAEAGLQARRMLLDPHYRPVFYPPINITGHLLAIYAAALAWLGDNIYSMRLVSVIFGLGGVLAAYLFGRELRGPRFGLALAFLLAIARWHVNFSRIAMTGVDTPFFEFLNLYFLLRLLRRGQLRDALWAGLSLGFGLMFYTAFRLYVVTLVIFAVVAVVAWWPWLAARLRGEGWRHWLACAGLLLFTTWLVVIPLARFARDNSEAFWYRTQQISILTKRDQADLGAALWTSTGKHLLMFNFHGDNNGRHNLPGEPMLDPAMAVLGLLGLGLAAAWVKQPANTFFLVLFPVALAGGIFSVDFEAPQSLRSIAVIPPVIYFAGLALAALGREAERSLAPLPRAWVIAPAVILAGYMFLANATTYFDRQAGDFASWNAFSAPETITGQKMAELGPAYKYYLSPFLTSHPTLRFLAPATIDQRPLLLPDALPVREPADRPVALFIHPDDRWIFDEAQRLYPAGVFEVATSHTEDQTPVVYFAALQPADLAAIQGLQLSYYRRSEPGEDPTPASGQAALVEPAADVPVQTNRVPNVSLAWPGDNPAGNQVAEWSGVLYAPRYGPYGLRLFTPGPARLEIDGNLVFEGQGEQLTGLPLAEGNHAFHLEAAVEPGQVELYWQPPGLGEELLPQWALYTPPVTNHGLLGTFYPNDQWAGQPAFERIDPFLDVYFHLVPLHRPYTVEWTGSLVVSQPGLYRLGLRAVQEAQLFLNGQLLVSTLVPNEYYDEPVTLRAERYDIRIRYKDTTDRSRIHLYWIRPDGQFEAIPSQNLWPPMGRYPQRPDIVSETATQPLSLTWLVTLGSPGSRPGQFLEPRDVAVLPEGDLVIADTGNKRVQVIDPQGTPLWMMLGAPYDFQEPVALGVNSRREVLVLDSTLQWVYRYQPTGELIDRFGGPTAYLFHPRGLSVFNDDTVALADTGTSRIVLFNAAGSQAGVIGGLGSGPGQFNEPTDVLRDAQGSYFVAESENDRIQRVDGRGNPLGQWAIPPAYAYNGPHLAFGPDGSIFMTESESGSLFRYAPDGALLDQWQTIDPVTLAAPVGIYFDANRSRLYVTDVKAHQIHVFAVQPTSN